MAAAVRAIRAKKRRSRNANANADDDSFASEVGSFSESTSFSRAHTRKLAATHVAGFGQISTHWGRILPYQANVMAIYITPYVTWSVASVIIGNFLAIILEKEFDP